MEHEKDLNRLTERAAKVKGMISHPGWKDVVKPALLATCQGWLSAFRIAKTPEELLKAQVGLLAAEFLLNVPEVVIADGVDANDKLEALKKSEN